MNDKLIRALEAILFIYGDPVSFRTLAHRLGCSAQEAESACEELDRQLRARNAGLALIINGGTAQMATAADLARTVEAFVKRDADESLTPAALETLSIVSYLAPVSRPEIEYIRGVNSAFTLRNLLIRGLIEKAEDPAKGRGQNLYRASASLLQYLGIQRAVDLPAYEEHHRLLDEYRSQKPIQ